MKKTVWYISKYFAPKTPTAPGGRGWFLMKGLSLLGYNTVVMTSDSNALIQPVNLDSDVKIENVDGVQLIWLRTLQYNIAKSPKRILSWFHFEWKLLSLDKRYIDKPDVVVVSSLSLLTVLNGLLLKWKFKCRLIFEVRDIWPLTITEEGGFSKFNPFVLFLSFVEKVGYKYSDAIIGTMPNLKAHVEQICDSKVPVHCIPMGVSDQQVSDSEELNIDYINEFLLSGKMKVIHAGTIGITNALEVFFEAAEKLSDNLEIEFILAGDGPLRDEYIIKYGHLPNLNFVPTVSKNQVQSLLSHCDVVYFSVFPSKVWEYGQSLNKVIDYMLSGKLVIASYYGFPSMVNEAQCGFFVPAGDAKSLSEKLVQVSKLSKEERDTIGMKGRKWLFENRNYQKLSLDYSKILFPEGNND